MTALADLRAENERLRAERDNYRAISEARLATISSYEAARETGWLPIETAPKGALNYLVYQPDHKAGRNILNARVVMADAAGFVREATHWMPLPPLPEQEPRPELNKEDR